MLHKRQRIQVVQEAAARQQVRAGQPQLSRRTPAENKTPPCLVRIVERLDRIEDRWGGLRLIHKNELAFLAGRKTPTRLRKLPRVGKVTRTLLRICQVESERPFWNKPVE